MDTSGKKLLTNINMDLKPATVNLIIGPSGSGKTKSLDCLAARTSSSLQESGEIKVNGAERDQMTCPKLAVYVGQTFPAYEWQTVRETLYFAVKIKKPNESEIDKAVDKLITLLGLESSENTYIGNLSGGERIRVSMGIEIIGDPPIVLLDEPIFGLDSYNAIRVLKIVKELADMQKTVLITVHQPSFKMMEYFDNINIIAKGKLVFSGTLDSSIDFFDKCGYPLPPKTNPTDFYLDILSTQDEIDENGLNAHTRIDELKKQFDQNREKIKNEITTKPHVSFSNVWYNNTTLLMFRALSNHFRNKPLIYGKLIQRVVIAILFGFNFLRLGTTGANAFSFRGALFFFIINELFGNSGPILNTFGEESKIIYRERKSGMYSGYEAYLSKFLTEVFITYIYAIPYTLVVYYLVGFNSNFGTCIIFLIIILAFILLGISYGLTVSIITHSKETAQVLGITLNVIFTLYSGALSVPSTIPSWLRWLVWLSPIYYIFAALCKNQLKDTDSNITSPDLINGQETLDLFKVNSLSITANIFVILGFTLFFSILGSVVLHRKSKNNLNLSRNPQQI